MKLEYYKLTAAEKVSLLITTIALSLIVGALCGGGVFDCHRRWLWVGIYDSGRVLCLGFRCGCCV